LLYFYLLYKKYIEDWDFVFYQQKVVAEQKIESIID